MNKKSLILEIAKQTDIKKSDVDKVLNSFLEIIGKELKKDNRVILSNFGVFSLLKKKATTRVNPRTRAKVNVPAKKVAKLRFSNNFNKIFN